MRYMDPFEHARRVREKDWRGVTFPPAADLPRPWFTDGDLRWRQEPTKRHPDSDRIIENMKRHRLVFDTGDTTPTYDGRTEGVFLNVATKDDPEFTISKKNGKRNLCVTTQYRAPYGQKVRIPKDAINQGWPMQAYSDSKMHILDTTNPDRSKWFIVEIQFIVDVSRNPILDALMNFIKLFGLSEGGGGYQCHGVKIYSFSESSLSVEGSSAANVPIAPSQLRRQDAGTGWTHMTSAGVPECRKGKYVYPATATDGTSLDPYAPQQGMIMKLKPEAKARFMKEDPGPLTRHALDCYEQFGICIIDTAGNIGFGYEPDPDIDQSDVKVLEGLTMDDFEIWTIK